MTNQLSEAVRSLQRAKEKASQRLAEVDRERREIRASLKSLDSALRALGHDDKLPETGNQASTTAEVIDLMAQFLTVNHALSVDQLSKMIAEELAKQGMSRAGLSLRLEQALKDSRFQQANGQVRLRTEPDRSTETK